MDTNRIMAAVVNPGLRPTVMIELEQWGIYGAFSDVCAVEQEFIGYDYVKQVWVRVTKG